MYSVGTDGEHRKGGMHEGVKMCRTGTFFLQSLCKGFVGYWGGNGKPEVWVHWKGWGTGAVGSSDFQPRHRTGGLAQLKAQLHFKPEAVTLNSAFGFVSSSALSAQFSSPTRLQ